MWCSLDGEKVEVNGVTQKCDPPYCYLGANNQCVCPPCAEDDLGCQVAVDAITNGCNYPCHLGYHAECFCPPPE